MNRNLNAPNLSMLGGRPVSVRVSRASSGLEAVVPGVIEIRDVTGDQDGPAVVVVLDREAAEARKLPHTLALDTATIARFLHAPPDATLEVALR